MTEIQLRVTAHQITVRNASEFLSSLAIMRDGIELLVDDAVNGYANKLSAQFPSLFPTIDSVLDLLTAMGRIVIDDHNWPLLPNEQQVLVTEALLNVSSDKEGLRFVSLHSGSLDGFFQDVFDKIGRIFRNLIEASDSIISGREGLEMKSTVRAILAESERDRDTQLAVAGVLMIGAEKYKKSLDAMNASDVVLL